MALTLQMDETPNLLVSLVPLGALARQTFRHPINQNRYQAGPKLVDLSEDPPPISSRESTPEAASAEATTDETSMVKTLNRRDESAIQLSLDKPPRCLSRGFAFGSDPEGLLVINTARDKNPLEVSYGDGEDAIVRSRYNFVLFPEKKVISVKLANNLQFEISFPDAGNLARAKTNFLKELKGSSLSINELQEKTYPRVTHTAEPLDSISRYEAKFTKFAKLGEGRFGAVHEIREVSTAARFAIKMVFPGNEKSQEYKNACRMLSDEFKALFRLDHKRIVTSYALLRAFGSLCLIMELMPLGNLETFTKKRELTMEEASMVLWQNLDALDYLHTQDITHRDLKMENLLVAQISPSLKIKLADFGLAKVPRNSADYLKTFCGTAPCMAPEMFAGNPSTLNYTSTIDIWALGVVMLECLDIRPARKYWNRARSEWCKELLFAFQATSDAPKGPIRAFLTYIMGRALLRQKPVARLSAGATLTHFTGFFQQIQFMDDAADRQSKSNPRCMGMPPGWSDALSQYCAQEMRTKKFFPNILPTDKKEDPERSQKVAKADSAKSQKKAESGSVKARKKVNCEPAKMQPRNLHMGNDGKTTVTSKAGTSPKAPAAPPKPVKSPSGQKFSHAAQPKFKGPTLSSGRKHGLEGDDAVEPVGGSTSQKRKRA